MDLKSEMDKKMEDWLCKTFKGYKAEMYEGDLPVCKGHKMIDGGFSDKWECKFGGGESYKGEILFGSFSLNEKIEVFICYGELFITDIRYSGKADVWEFSTKGHSLLEHGRKGGHEHELETEKIEHILDGDFGNCTFGSLMKKIANDLYEEYNKEKGHDW